MNTPEHLRYAASHEWALSEADGSVTVGITDHAQEQLGDLVYIGLPEVGRVVTQGEAVAVVESVKSASDIYAPVSGTIAAIHEALVDAPEALNADAYGAWLFRITPTHPEELDSLLNAAAYTASVGDH